MSLKRNLQSIKINKCSKIVSKISPVGTGVSKTYSGGRTQVMTSYDQTIRHEDVWKIRLEDMLRTSVKRYLCCNVVAISVQSGKKYFFLILHCLKYSENL